MTTTAKPISINGPVTDEWLRSLGLPASKQPGGTYSSTKTDLLIELEDFNRKEAFWVLGFSVTQSPGEWFVSLTAYEESRRAAHFWPAPVKTRADVMTLFKALGLPPKKRGDK